MKGVQQLLSTITAIRMGDLAVSANDGVLRTLLGSCIGLALYDHTHKVGGLAHIVLMRPMDATLIPLPSELTTPPVTKINFVGICLRQFRCWGGYLPDGQMAKPLP